MLVDVRKFNIMEEDIFFNKYMKTDLIDMHWDGHPWIEKSIY